MVRVFDVFIFFNELDLLDIRLNTLNDKVDFFVLVESTISFSGKPKRLYYQENKHLFEKFNHKIIHHIIDDTPNSFEEIRARFLNSKDELEKNIALHCLTTSNVPPGEVHWLREFYQKENMRRALTLSPIEKEDICFISDLDEIWNPELDYELEDDSVYKLKQLVYLGFLNNRSSEDWNGTIYSKYKNIYGSSVNHLDTQSKTKYTLVENGGWHFTYQGGSESIKTKIENFGHQEYNNDSVKNRVNELLENNQDVLGRTNFQFWTDESQLPKYLLDNKEKYKAFFK